MISGTNADDLLDRKNSLATENECFFDSVKHNVVVQTNGVQAKIDAFVDNTQLQTSQLLEKLSRFGVSHDEVLNLATVS